MSVLVASICISSALRFRCRCSLAYKLLKLFVETLMCSKFYILKKLLVWVFTKVDHSICLLTRRQMKILNIELIIWFFNFIILIFEVESSSMISLTSFFSLWWHRVSSSSNWTIFTDRVLFSCFIWTLTWFAAFAYRWSVSSSRNAQSH